MIDPTAAPAAAATGARRATRPARLDGLTVGLLANTKKNAEPFLDAVADLLARQHGTGGVVRRKKLSITTPCRPTCSRSWWRPATSS